MTNEETERYGKLLQRRINTLWQQVREFNIETGFNLSFQPKDLDNIQDDLVTWTTAQRNKAIVPLNMETGLG